MGGLSSGPVLLSDLVQGSDYLPRSLCCGGVLGGPAFRNVA